MEFISSDKKTKIYGTIYKPNTKPIGMIQLIHGIGENMGRYEDFAAYFNSQGYIVYGIDVIGHGRSLQDEKNRVYFGKEGSWDYVVNDVYYMYQYMINQYHLPCFMLGFSIEKAKSTTSNCYLACPMRLGVDEFA